MVMKNLAIIKVPQFYLLAPNDHIKGKNVMLGLHFFNPFTQSYAQMALRRKERQRVKEIETNLEEKPKPKSK